MATNKINIAPFIRFTFLVWIKSVPLILIGLLLFNADLADLGSESIFQIIGSAIMVTFVAFIYTSPFFIMMLIVVYIINRIKWPIAKQKFFIFFIYALPILILMGASGPIYESKEIIFVILILTVSAVMIYFTKLLPSDKQLVDDKERDDIIDDISFED